MAKTDGGVHLRYRVDLYTNKDGKWFAEIEYHRPNGTTGFATGWTKTAETWAGAIALAIAKIDNNQDG